MCGRFRGGEKVVTERSEAYSAIGHAGGTLCGFVSLESKL